MCVSVCVFRVDVETNGPIFTKLSMRVHGGMGPSIGYPKITWPNRTGHAGHCSSLEIKPQGKNNDDVEGSSDAAQMYSYSTRFLHSESSW
jgi:hypothetical protein